MLCGRPRILQDFYPRSPCGERLAGRHGNLLLYLFLSTLSLRRATNHKVWHLWAIIIFLSTLSLRRATPQHKCCGHRSNYFYPRSPCGERLECWAIWNNRSGISIHALLAESDPRHGIVITSLHHFYPRSPCGERPSNSVGYPASSPLFLSTLSLRRATRCQKRALAQSEHFYPRSPCGERP